jgi:uncharacterized protein YjdB
MTAIANGNASVSVRTNDGGFIASCAVIVAVAVTSVSISPKTKTLAALETQQLTPTVLPAGALNKSVTYVSSDITKATVDANGLVSAVATGSATITVTTIDGSHTDTCAITVS